MEDACGQGGEERGRDVMASGALWSPPPTPQPHMHAKVAASAGSCHHHHMEHHQPTCRREVQVLQVREAGQAGSVHQCTVGPEPGQVTAVGLEEAAQRPD